MRCDNLKCREFQEVAALVCNDIDTFVLAARANPEDALQFLEMLKDFKDEIIKDGEKRRDRYNAGCLVYSAVTGRS
jgi:hypothetical protein